jgi:hypothetical protein
MKAHPLKSRCGGHPLLRSPARQLVLVSLSKVLMEIVRAAYDKLHCERLSFPGS